MVFFTPPPAEYRVIAMTEEQRPAEKQETALRVRKAFDAVRTKDLSQVSDLQQRGPAVVPMLAPYLDDKDESVRREAVSLLAGFAGEASLPLLTKALGDSAADVQERAATALYEKYDPATLAEQADLGHALARRVKAGDPPAAAVLLLAYFPTPESEKSLRSLQDGRSAAKVKLFAWSAPVSISLPAKVALARLGSGEAQAALLQAAQKASTAEAEFLLAALREADTSAVLRGLARFLDDKRESTTLVHSAPEIRPRICDLAVNAFVQRLKLPVTFEINKPRRYEAGQIEEVRRAILSAVPERPTP
jgi:HEAT repeat protein